MDEDEIPDLEDIGVVQVYKMGCIPATDPIVVDLCKTDFKHYVSDSNMPWDVR